MNPVLQIFLLGLATSFGPCLFLCAPLIFPLLFTQNQRFLFLFLLSRLLTFLLLSLLAYLLGRIFFQVLGGAKGLLFLFAGLFLYFLGIWSTLREKRVSCPKRLTKGGSFLSIFLGLLFGLLPCPPSLAVLTYIMVEGKGYLHSLLLGLAFGSGELILPLFLASFLPSLFSRLSPKVYKVFQFLSLIIFFLIGAQLIRRGLLR